jgi:outer membrane receptor protein involved in Fe transport
VNGFIASMGSTGGDFAKSVQDNAKLLEKANIDFVKPEKVASYEVGYKSLISDKLLFDFSYHYSQYQDFIGLQVVMNTPTEIDNPMAGADILTGKSRVYLVYSNAKGSVSSQGFSGSLTYTLPKGFSVSGNYTWAKLSKEDDADPIIPAFNTPEHKVNLTFGNRNVYKNIGFNLVWHWQDKFMYQFAFVPGYNAEVPSFQTLDAQISARLRKNLGLKVGGTNIFNTRYVQAFGAATIGSLYYVSLTFDPLLR